VKKTVIFLHRSDIYFLQYPSITILSGSTIAAGYYIRSRKISPIYPAKKAPTD
jgi:hypothetical protein